MDIWGESISGRGKHGWQSLKGGSKPSGFQDSKSPTRLEYGEQGLERKEMGMWMQWTGGGGVGRPLHCMKWEVTARFEQKSDMMRFIF